MNTYTNKTQESKNQSLSNAVSQKKGRSTSSFHFVDNKPEAITQRKQQEAINNSSHVQQLKAYQEMANSHTLSKNIIQFTRKGSHGKILCFKITTVQITNSTSNNHRYVNINHTEKLGKVMTHKHGIPLKTKEDAYRIAAEKVELADNESITDVHFEHYTQ